MKRERNEDKQGSSKRPKLERGEDLRSALKEADKKTLKEISELRQNMKNTFEFINIRHTNANIKEQEESLKKTQTLINTEMLNYPVNSAERRANNQLQKKTPEKIESLSESQEENDLEKTQDFEKLLEEELTKNIVNLQTKIGELYLEENKSEQLKTFLTDINENKKIPLVRTNSKHFDKLGNLHDMTLDKRNFLSGSLSTMKGIPRDAFKIAIFSQEASPQHHEGYDDNLNKGEYLKTFEGKNQVKNMDLEIANQLKSGVNRIENVTDYETAIPELFRNKESPHVIAVVEGEGKILPKSVTLKEKNGESYTYTLSLKSIKGEKSDGSKDDRQNMNFYVRNDMSDAIQIEETNVPVPDRGEFTVGKISFETEEDKYSILALHIPNKFTDSVPKCQETQQALSDYANAVKTAEEKEKRTIVGYIGDTNYKEITQENSLATFGGNHEDQYLNSIASGDQKKHTVFMQAASFGTDQANSFLMAQPNALNQVGLNINIKMQEPQKKETVVKIRADHPSIQTTVILNGVIKNRKYSNENTKNLNLQNETVVANETNTLNKKTEETEPTESIAIESKTEPSIEETEKAMKIDVEPTTSKTEENIAKSQKMKHQNTLQRQAATGGEVAKDTNAIITPTITPQ